jgi:molecular chaperone HtpG
MNEETTVPESESLEFKTEVQQLLNILAKSLYTRQEIFLRELISNASDALHRMKFELLTNRDVVDPDAELEITIDFDEDANTLTVADTGVGMTRAELIENLGTIAHSGATAFLEQLEEGKRPDDIIGQFGVGFYSVFMVANEVKVTTRSYRPKAQAWTWISGGESAYTIEPADKENRGTVVEIQLNDDAQEFTSAWRLRQVVEKHSNYVSFPIKIEDEVINKQSALWRTPRNQIEEEDYEDFYRQLTLDTEPPLLHIHLVTDVPVFIRSILYVPRHLDEGTFQLGAEPGLKLYSKKVLIQDNTTDLLPDYLRFVEGVVDSDDLPLNISRETVQSNRILRQIERSLTGRVLSALEDLAEENPEEYTVFWQAFGAFIKQGIASQPFDQEDLLPLLRFRSSTSSDAFISLETYVERMDEEQPAIYYVIGNDLTSVASSPHLDYFKEHDLEVLYLTDPLDGLMMQSLREFDDKPFQNVDDPELDLPEDEETEEEQAEPIDAKEFGTLIGRFKDVLGDRVKDVRPSKILRDSPCRLVSAESGPERDLERVRRLIEQDYEVAPRILEINRRHPLIKNLAQMIESGTRAPVVDAAIEQLFANQLLLEGLHANPAEMVPRIQELLEAATDSQD